MKYECVRTEEGVSDSDDVYCFYQNMTAHFSYNYARMEYWKLGSTEHYYINNYASVIISGRL